MFSSHAAIAGQVVSSVRFCVCLSTRLLLNRLRCHREIFMGAMILGDNLLETTVPTENTPGNNPPPPRLGVLTLTDPRRGILTLTLTDPRVGIV